MKNTIESAAVAAYEAYCETRGWKSFDGKDLPYWPDAREDIKDGWRAATKAAIEVAEASLSVWESVEYVIGMQENLQENGDDDAK